MLVMNCIRMEKIVKVVKFNYFISVRASCKDILRLHCTVACGGELKDRNGTITSPSYPDRYPSNKKCSWSIKAPPLHKIQLSFKTFELEESGEVSKQH